MSRKIKKYLYRIHISGFNSIVDKIHVWVILYVGIEVPVDTFHLNENSQGKILFAELSFVPHKPTFVTITPFYSWNF